MFSLRDGLKTIGVAVSIIVLMPLIHELLNYAFSLEGSITGEPNIPLLLVFVCVQAVLLVVVYNVAKPYIPGKGGWRKGLVFASFFLLCVQIPSVFGVVAFEPGHEWEWFTAAKVANYVTLLGDVMVYLIVGALIGALFPAQSGRRIRSSGGLWVAAAVGAVGFPVALWGILHLAFGLLPVDDPNAPVGRSLWFNLVFFGAFFLTGLCLPFLHVMSRRVRNVAGLRAVCRTTVLFALLWLPVQNFMVVFGWEVGGALFFSALSMVPGFLVLWATDRLILESALAPTD